MGTKIWIIFIVSLIVAAVLVNKVQRLYMKLMGAEYMFFNGKKKLIAIVIIGLLITSFVVKIFKIPIPV